MEKLDVKMVQTPLLTVAVNLCESPEMIINYTHKDKGHQMMILDIGVLVSIAGVLWMTQYLREFGLTIEEMKFSKCSQPFVFGPSRRYLSQTLVELPVLVTRLNG